MEISSTGISVLGFHVCELTEVLRRLRVKNLQLLNFLLLCLHLVVILLFFSLRSGQK